MLLEQVHGVSESWSMVFRSIDLRIVVTMRKWQENSIFFKAPLILHGSDDRFHLITQFGKFPLQVCRVASIPDALLLSALATEV